MKNCLNNNIWGEDCDKKPLSPNQNPTILDEIIFKFKTTKTGELCANCCDEEDELCNAECINPYKFDNITIYFIERNFSNTNAYTDDNLSTFYYSDASVVKSLGTKDFPAWLSTDPNNSYINKVEKDKNGNLLVGCFEYVWSPVGLREGDYFICWTYTPYSGGNSISSHLKFYLNSGNEINTSIPTHRTNPKKYYDLLERYTPEMFKEFISDKDQTPLVLDKLNKSIAKGFNVLEDLTNQIVDLLDSNSVNEYIIYYLSNTLNLKLKSSDPTLWRRQIKEAVPLYKTKGTLGSLKNSLEQSGMRLLRVSNFWQLVSPFYFLDSFIINDSDVFILTHKVDNNVVEVFVSSPEQEILLNSSDYEVTEDEYLTKVKLNISLDNFTIVKIKYCYNQPKNIQENNLSDYIENLPLMDNRSEYLADKVIYPLKNWNVKLVDENDPLIHDLIVTRHPFQKDVIFGKVRTEFPYSENIYNSEEYNGSLRDSTNPCDIDREFIDKCSSCRSSNFDVDVEIQSLSDDRIQEAFEIITENCPFHSVLRLINFYGGNYEYVASPMENYDILITYKYVENNISGDLQRWFYRSKLDLDLKKRNELSDKTLSFSKNIKLFNEKIVLFSPNVDFKNINFYENKYVEILSPSVYSGVHPVSNPNNNYVNIDINNYINDSFFSFNMFDDIISFSGDLERDDYIELIEEDSSINFIELNLDSNYKVLINDIAYELKQVLSYNKLIIKNNNNSILNNFSSNYSILNSNGEVIVLKPSTSSSYCKIVYHNLTIINKSLLVNKDIFKNFNLELIFEKSGINYICQIIDFNDDKIFIKNYYDENVGAIQMKIRRLILKNEAGNLIYSGVKAEVDELSSDFIDNFDKYSIKITSQNFNNNYYFISDILNQNNKYILSLHGDFENLGLDRISCSAEFYNYKEKLINIEDKKRGLDSVEMKLNRNNLSLIEAQKLENQEEENFYVQNKGNSFAESTVQKENIFVKIETISGEETEVKL